MPAQGSEKLLGSVPEDAPIASEGALVVKKGFLNDAKDALYPGGSEQGKVSTEQQRAWAENDMNKDMDKKQGLGPYSSE